MLKLHSLADSTRTYYSKSQTNLHSSLRSTNKVNENLRDHPLTKSLNLLDNPLTIKEIIQNGTMTPIKSEISDFEEKRTIKIKRVKN